MTEIAEDPCGCHSTLAEHEATTEEAPHQGIMSQSAADETSALLPSISPTTEFVGQDSVMEFGHVRLYGGDGAPISPLVPLLLLVWLATTFIRHCRNPVRYVTFRQLLFQTPQPRGPSAFRQNLTLAFSFRHLRLHEMEAEIRCAYCKDAFTDTREAFSCSECATLHHRDCYVDHCGCAVFGCARSGRSCN